MIIRKKLIPLTVALSLVTLSLRAQNFTIDWHKIAGGAGTGSDINGQYSLTGTIGQHDAGATGSGGNFSLAGGLWTFYALQTPGSPLLNIFVNGPNSVVVAWTASPGAFSLQMNADLTTTNWTAVANPTTVTNSQNQVTILPQPGNMFFRLKSL